MVRLEPDIAVKGNARKDARQKDRRADGSRLTAYAENEDTRPVGFVILEFWDIGVRGALSNRADFFKKRGHGSRAALDAFSWFLL